MLSYRHGFHAGNHADVLKHIVLCLLIRSLQRKDKPFTYIDTHSGAGAYSLISEWSNKTGEFKNGIAKVIHDEQLEKLVPEYYSAIRDVNDQQDLTNYPGSPFIATSLCRETDELQLIELHPNEYENLKYNLHYNHNAHVHHRSAQEGLNALLPPKIRRGLVLIDPSYEIDKDYRDTVKLVKNAYQKFPEGIYAIWYPKLGKAIDQSYDFVRTIGKLGIKATLQVELAIATQDEERGMNASGMIICNCPYLVDEELTAIMPHLTKLLAVDNGAGFKLGFLNPRV